MGSEDGPIHIASIEEFDRDVVPVLRKAILDSRLREVLHEQSTAGREVWHEQSTAGRDVPDGP